MGRKPKAKASEDQPPLVAQPLGGDASPPVSTLPFTEELTFEGQQVIQTETTTINEEEVGMDATPDIDWTIYEDMSWAFKEIIRCNDYIFSKADLDRRFYVYREELYEFRYKLRQLKLHPMYPNIPMNMYPTKPDYVADV